MPCPVVLLIVPELTLNAPDTVLRLMPLVPPAAVTLLRLTARTAPPLMSMASPADAVMFPPVMVSKVAEVPIENPTPVGALIFNVAKAIGAVKSVISTPKPLVPLVLVVPVKLIAAVSLFKIMPLVALLDAKFKIVFVPASLVRLRPVVPPVTVVLFKANVPVL